MVTRRGIIEGISGHPMSGLWQILISGQIVHIGSGHGVRALAACFGATEGKGDLQEKISGQDIVYSVDAFGVMDGFTPYKEWRGTEIEIGEEIYED